MVQGETSTPSNLKPEVIELATASKYQKYIEYVLILVGS